MAPTPSRVEDSAGHSPRRPPTPTLPTQVRLPSEELSSQRTPSRTLSDPLLPVTSTEERLQATQQRVQELEQLYQLQEQQEKLIQKLGLNSAENGRKRKRSSSQSSGSTDHGHHDRPIKVKNLIRFTASMTHRRRREWLQDLQRAFAGDRKRFRTDYNKILFALDQMDEHPRNRWYSHCENLIEPERSITESSWQTFEDWTTICVVDIADQASTLAKAMNLARQRDDQSPWDFHYYLESLEAQLPKQDDKTRALTFYTKLSRFLIDHIDRYILPRPETREEMVKTASQIWHSFHRTQSQRGRPNYPSSNTPRFRHNGPHSFGGPRPFHSGHHDDKTERKPDDSHTKPQHTSNESQAGSTEKRTCYTCGEEGHLSYDCPEGAQVNTFHGYSSGRRRGRGSYRGSGPNRQGNGRHSR
jgi:hypothetical protein